MKVQLFLPVEPEHAAHALKHKLLTRFGGFTITNGEGHYQNHDGAHIKEHVEVVTVFVGFWQAEQAEAWLADVTLDYGRHAKQESVLYTIDDEPYFVDVPNSVQVQPEKHVHPLVAEILQAFRENAG